ncbi:DUF4148 domain-containing protein [Pseudoduganella dura]|uniref:DUF4148 domain-containing protein n=1 Tax=Pseudoduganella dura TaxID=321982 RepID=UPI0016732DD2|nr:DUF4148 domain-containing protein [Pseudoduganella dura]GGX81905.1 hypothetical protein GCM10007386_11030 [Pseudoduganella dura]
MKTATTLIAALTLASAGAAFAAEEPANAAAVATSTAAAAGTTTVAITQQAPRQQGRTRAEVKAQVIAARRNGTLIETEADMDVAQTRKHYAQ